MKISRSAIVILIAVIILLIAIFTMQSGEDAVEPAVVNSETANLTPSAPSDSTPVATSNATEPEEKSGIGASNATIEEGNATSAGVKEAASAMQEANAGLEQKNATPPAANATIEESTTAVTQANGTAPASANPTLTGAAGICGERAANVLIEKAARLEKEAAEKAAAEKAAKEKAEKEKAEKAAKEKAAKEKAEKEKVEKAAKEKAAREKTKAEQAKPAPKEQPRVAVAPTTPSVGSAPGDVMNKLVDFGANRVSLINRSIAPSKSSRQVTQEGGKYVGRYYYVEPSSLHVEASPADPSSPFKYIGKVRYREGFYEIRANSREEALKGEGSVIQQRNMCELIQYKNNKWLE